jgi:hypothetical protein
MVIPDECDKIVIDIERPFDGGDFTVDWKFYREDVLLKIIHEQHPEQTVY